MTNSPSSSTTASANLTANTTNHDAKANPHAFGKVAVVCGGNSNEREVSLNSGMAVLKALQSKGVDASQFDPKTQNIVELQGYDRVFNVLHGRGGEDGQLQGVLDWLNIAQTGSGVLASALGMDKVRTKQLWQGCQLPTAPFAVLNEHSNWQQIVDTLGLPLMVKPIHEGSSIGMSKVTHVDELPKAYQTAAGCGDKVMAEKWIEGQEFTIAIIDGTARPVIRLEPADTNTFYDYEAKYQRNDTSYHIPCGLDAAAESHLQQLSEQAFAAVGAAGWGRIDAMQDAAGNFWLLEINTVPGMTDHSLVPMAAKAGGMDFADLCLHILSQTL